MVGELPKLLAKEYQISLFEKLNSEKTTRLRKKRIKAELITHNIRLAHKIAHNTYYGEYEDNLSAAFTGLVIAVDKFKPGISSFSTFATLIIKQEILHEWKKNYRLQRNKFKQESFDALYNNYLYSGHTRGSTKTQQDNTGNYKESILLRDEIGYEATEYGVILKQIFDIIKVKYKPNNLDYRIFVDYISGMTQQELSSIYHMSQPQISRTINRVRRNIKEGLGNNQLTIIELVKAN